MSLRRCLKRTEGGKVEEKCEACPSNHTCPYANITACEKVCHSAPTPPHPEPTKKYICNLEKHRCEEGDFLPAFPSLLECEHECVAPPGYICGKTTGRCERSNSSKATAEECEKTCKPEEKHYKCDEKTARCELSTESRDTMEECAHACKPKPTHGYECNHTVHRCESVAGGHHASANLTACDKECKPEEKGYKCDHATKRCEESSESRDTMEECAHACNPEPTHGYECNRTAHRCESVAGSRNTNLTLCEHECKPPEPEPTSHGYVCNATLKTCERSEESKHTISECEAECHHTAAHGYECSATLKKCISKVGASQKNITLCEHECDEPKPTSHGYVCNATLKTCERR